MERYRSEKKSFFESIFKFSFLRFIGKLALDCAILLASLFIAFLLRFGGEIPSQYFPLFPVYFAIELLLLIFFEVVSGTYKSLWRYTEFRDALAIFILVSLQKLSFSALSFFFLSPPYPRSVIIISWAFTLIGMGGIRFLRRYFYEKLIKVGEMSGEKRTLIVGAGSAGRRLAKEISDNPHLGYKIIGFLDDDPAKKGSYVLGYPILDSIENIRKVIVDHDIEEVIIAIPSLPQKTKEVFNTIVDMPVKVTSLPSLGKLTLGRPLYQSIKEIDLADLLTRPPVEVNIKEIARFLQGKTVLVTGAGGSIGSELCRQLASFPLKKLLLLEHSENPLFYILGELREKKLSFPIEPIIVDIRNEEKIRTIFRQHRPQIVFHTAAHKHVPLMEYNPDEAITNNVYGTKVLAEAAMEVGAEKFVYISTDKAVNPVSVMGASKRVGELLMKFLNGKSSTAFISVRFGNVLGSRGSVLEVWEKCIEENKPIPITHPDMERYFMTIPEAVNLILKSAEMGQGGELFVLDMGERVKIEDLAKFYTRLRGLILGRDIEKVITGIREGEKLKEELIGEGEVATPTSHRSIMRIVSNDEIEDDFPEKLEVLFKSALSGDPLQIKSALKDIIKNYS